MKLTKQLLKEMILNEMATFSYDQAGSAGSMGHEGSYQEAYEILANPQGPAQMVFITAHNPPYLMRGNGEWDNTKAQNMLLQDLSPYKNMMIGKGQYMGDQEETIMVLSNNPVVQDGFRDHMIMLGKKYLQDAIVYAEKTSGMAMDRSRGEHAITPEGKPIPSPSGYQGTTGPRYFWNLQMLNLNPTMTNQPSGPQDWRPSKFSTYMLSNPSIQGRSDDFTMVGGKKYYIPFYEDVAEEYIPNVSPVR